MFQEYGIISREHLEEISSPMEYSVSGTSQTMLLASQVICPEGDGYDMELPVPDGGLCGSCDRTRDQEGG